MSNFTRSVQFTTEFDGDTISMSLARLKQKHKMVLGKFMSLEGEDIKFTFESYADFMDAMIDIMPECVSGFSGLKDSQGNAIILEEMLDELYFNPLIQTIANELFNISFAGKEDLGKLQLPSSEGSTA